MDINNLTELDVILALLDTHKLIKLYHEAYNLDYIKRSIINTMEELDRELCYLQPSFLFPILLSSSNFKCSDDYFIFDEDAEKIESYSENGIRDFILKEYKGHLKDFYSNDKEEFLKAILNNNSED